MFMMTPCMISGLSVSTENLKFSLPVYMFFHKHSSIQNRPQVCSRCLGILQDVGPRLQSSLGN